MTRALLMTKCLPLLLALFACSAPSSAPTPPQPAIPEANPAEQEADSNQDDAREMWAAVYAGDSDSVTAWLERGVDPNVEYYCERPLHLAAALDRVAVVEVLLKAGAQFDHPDTNGRTALHEAASGGCLNVAEVLVRAGARADHADKVGLTPLHLAAQEDQLLMFDFLVMESSEFSTDARTNWGTTLLHEAAASGSTRIVERLCSYRNKREFEVDARDQNRRTPLHLAALRGDIASFEALVASGADTEAVDAFGFSPSQYARKVVESALTPAVQALERIDVPKTWDGQPPVAARWQDRPYGGATSQGLVFAAWADGVILFATDTSRPRESLRIGRVTAKRVEQFVEELRGTGLPDVPRTGNSFEMDHIPYSVILVRSGGSVVRRQWCDGIASVFLQRAEQASVNRSLANAWSRAERAIARLCSAGGAKFSPSLWSADFRGFDCSSLHPPDWMR